MSETCVTVPVFLEVGNTHLILEQQIQGNQWLKNSRQNN